METLIGVLLGEAEPERAARLVETAGRCPYCAISSHAGGTFISLYAIPKELRWWLEWVERDPYETLGLRKAEVLFARHVAASSPWSRREVEAVLEQAPCGADCPGCPKYGQGCRGCPATRHYFTD